VGPGLRTCFSNYAKRKFSTQNAKIDRKYNNYLFPKRLVFVEISNLLLSKKKKSTKYNNPDYRREGSHCYSCSMQGKSNVRQNIFYESFKLQRQSRNEMNQSRVSNNNMVSFTFCLTIQFRLTICPAIAPAAKPTPASTAISGGYSITNDIENET
jgi:hypothetical protein